MIAAVLSPTSANFLDARLPDRFWSKCIPEPNSGCWLWIGNLDRDGYGSFSVGATRSAKRPEACVMSDFCAICVSDRGEFVREPIGKDDALVTVCRRCATEEVPEPEERHVVRVVRVVPTDPRHTRIKANRDRLIADGKCMYGRNHGPHVDGRLCAECRGKYRARGR